MIEPLYWNPLPDAAAWLTQKTGRTMDARTLVDTVAQMGQEGSPTPTIIKAMLPNRLKFASLSIGKRKLLPESDAEKFLREILVETSGPLPVGMSYLSVAYPTTSPLCVNNLLQLLMHGKFTTGFVLDKNPSDGGMVFLMPWGTEYTATIETCGINRADLLALGDKLTLPAPTAATPAPKEAVSASSGDEPWKEQARARAYEIIKRDKEKDLYPSQVDIADEIAKQFRKDGLKGADGKPLKGAYIKRHALNGISSAQSKLVSTVMRQSK